MKGRPEGYRIDDYVVEDHADHVLGTRWVRGSAARDCGFGPRWHRS